MFVAIINEIFLLMLRIKITSVEELLLFWVGVAGVTRVIHQYNQREEILIAIMQK